MLEVALFGKPNAGKSSFFKAATLIDVKIASYPFTTLKPNTGIAYVTSKCACRDFGVKCNPRNSKCLDGVRLIPIRLWDIAGLVKDAHLGRGMGTSFLDDIRQASCLIHVVDASGLTDAEGKPTVGYNPANDIKVLEEEIDLWFASVVERAVSKIKNVEKIPEPELVEILAKRLSGLRVKRGQIRETLERVSLLDVKGFASELRKVSKPILVAANKIDLPEAQRNFEELKKMENVVPTSAEAEIALRKAAEKGLIAYTPGNGFKVVGELNEAQKKGIERIKRVIEKYGSTGIQTSLNRAVFGLLKYKIVYPVANSNKLCDTSGNVLPDALLVPPDTTLKDLAYLVHTEIGEKFIGGINARSKQKLGADYLLKNNDVVEILFKH